MYIAQAGRFKHEPWRYIIGIMLVIAAVVMGQIPLTAVILFAGDLTTAASDPMQVLSGLDSNLALFLMLFTFAMGLVGVILAIRFIHGQSFTSLTTARKKIDWSRIGFGFGIVAIYTIASVLIGYWLVPEDFEFNFQPLPFLILCIVAVIMVPLQTSFEEYFFRGYLMQFLGLWAKNKWLPLVVTSVIFGLLHITNPEVAQMGYIIMIYYVGTGFFLGIITLMDEGMELSLGFHAGNNLIGALLITADWTAFQTDSIFKDISDPSAGLDILVPVLVFYPVFILIMARKYKWNNWKEKLFGKVVVLKEEKQELI
ncbi:MAG: lysostaphin resistance A-like protein [Mesonia hippocampi]|uniref:CPBP family intramembrane glutamic endopeptidase n=1 Tax=Mesonia hippocampi TaxID=1628250 RepID=UPI003F960710